ncbi:hypothetical protein [Nostoc sp.]
MNKRICAWHRLLALAIALMMFAVFAPIIVQVADPPTIRTVVFSA